MRTLKYAILGLINQRDMSGYELTQQFESALYEFWTANHSQIYPELKKLTQEGSVEYQIEISGNVLEKKIYTITEQGRKEFLEWLEKDEPMGPTPKEVFRLRVFFSNRLEPEKRRILMENQLLQHQRRLRHLKNNQTKFKEIPQKESDEFSDYLVLLGAIMREEMMISWLQECLKLCEA